MATAAKTTKQIIQAYKAVRQVEALTQAKLDALLETNTLYKLFEPDTRHPYYVLADVGKNTLAAFNFDKSLKHISSYSKASQAFSSSR